jgi:hypothetical protein
MFLLSQLPKEFFTNESILTLTGASSATLLVCNTFQRIFNFNPKWLAFLISILIAFYGAYASGNNSIANYFLAFLNSFLIYSTTYGISQLTSKTENINNNTTTYGSGSTKSLGKRSFNSRW